MTAFYRVERDGERCSSTSQHWSNGSREAKSGVSNTLVSRRRQTIGRDLQLHGPRNRDRWVCAQALRGFDMGSRWNWLPGSIPTE
jgi:hypothetical protein